MRLTSPFAAFSMITLFVAGFGGGCQHDAGSEKPQPATGGPFTAEGAPADSAYSSAYAPVAVKQQPAMQSKIVARQLPQSAKPTVIKQGQLPLVYLVDSYGTFVINDATAKQSLVTTGVPKNMIIRVDARSGVVVGNETLVPGPLPGDHQYNIVRGVAAENESSGGYVSPAVP
jgi:hypothetical protein